MRAAVSGDLDAILTYLRRDIPNCIYMYIDIGKYGLDNPHMHVWLDEDADGLRLAVMQYYNSIQLYSLADDWDVDGVAALVLEKRVSVVNGRLAMLERLFPLCSELYELHAGEVFRFTDHIHKESGVTVEHAAESDFPEIARLVCSDRIFAHYTPESLAAQLLERQRSGMGRSVVIRRDGRIIAHIAVFADYGGIAVPSALIVHPDYRDYPYGSLIESYLLMELLAEGKEVYTFVTENGRKALLRALGCPHVADYGKMTLKQQE